MELDDIYGKFIDVLRIDICQEGFVKATATSWMGTTTNR
jgi:hypothetical protein